MLSPVRRSCRRPAPRRAVDERKYQDPAVETVQQAMSLFFLRSRGVGTCRLGARLQQVAREGQRQGNTRREWDHRDIRARPATEHVLQGLRDACEMIRQRFELYEESTLV